MSLTPLVAAATASALALSLGGAACASPARQPLVLGAGHVLQTYAYSGTWEFWGPFDSTRDHLGQATVAWRPSTGPIKVATRSSAGDWEATHAFGDDGAGDLFYTAPEVASDAAGNLTLVWSQSDGSGRSDDVMVTWRSAEGEWHTPVQLSRPGAIAMDPHLAVAANGTAMITWLGAAKGRPNVWTAVKGPRGSWPTVAPRHSTRLPHLSVTDIGISHRGKVVLVGGREDPRWTHLGPLVSSVWRPGRGWTRARVVTGQGGVDDFDVAVGPGGRAVLAWTLAYGKGEVARIMSRAGRWRRREVFERGPRDEGGSGPRAALDRRGVATVIYSRADRLIAMSKGTRGRWRRDIAVPDHAGHPVDLAVKADGTAAVIFESFTDRLHLNVTMRGPDGLWAAPAWNVSDGFFADNQDAMGTVVMLPSGRALLSYPNDDVGEVRSRAARIAPH